MSSLPSAKKIGRPKVDSEAVNVRMERPLLAELDAWIAGQPEPRPGRPEAIRRVLQDHLSTIRQANELNDTPLEDLGKIGPPHPSEYRQVKVIEKLQIPSGKVSGGMADLMAQTAESKARKRNMRVSKVEESDTKTDGADFLRRKA